MFFACTQSAGYIYITWSSCDEGLGGCPTPPQADPLHHTHLLGVPALAGISRGRSAPAPAILHLAPNHTARSYSPSETYVGQYRIKVLRMGQGSGKPSDEPLRTGRNPPSPAIPMFPCFTHQTIVGSAPNTGWTPHVTTTATGSVQSSYKSLRP